MRIVKLNQFKNLGELHKEWTEAGVKASRTTKHRRVKRTKDLNYLSLCAFNLFKTRVSELELNY